MMAMPRDARGGVGRDAFGEIRVLADSLGGGDRVAVDAVLGNHYRLPELRDEAVGG